MRKSEQTNELFAALARAQGKLKAAIRDAKNPFFKNKFATLAGGWDVAREALSENGLCVTQVTKQIPSGDWVLVSNLGHSSGQWIEGDFPLYYKDHTSQAIGSAMSYARRYSFFAIAGIVQDDDDGEASMGRNHEPKQEINQVQDKFAQHFSNEPVENLIKSVAPKPTPTAQSPLPLAKSSSVPHTHTGPQVVTEAQLKRLFAITKSSGWSETEVNGLLRERFSKTSRKDLLRAEYDEACNWIQTTPPPSMVDDVVM